MANFWYTPPMPGQPQVSPAIVSFRVPEGSGRLVFVTEGELWLYVELRKGWTACYRIQAVNGRPMAAELRVLPTPVNVTKEGQPSGHHEPPGDGLTAGLLKDEVLLGRHVYELLPAALRSSSTGWSGPLLERFFGSLGFGPDFKPERGRRGPKGEPDEYYARLAAAYVKTCKKGSPSPVANMAKARGVSAATLRQALLRARKRGLLTRQTAGKAGGELTPRAKSLLKKGS